MTALTIGEFTQATLVGTGVFDVLMTSVKAHLDSEFTKGRIKGPEYSTVYLGSLDLAMQTGLTFLLQQRKNDLEAQLLEKQILIAEQQRLNLVAEAANIPKQGLILDVQKDLITQQAVNLVAEAANIPKQGLLIDAEKAQKVEQTALVIQQKTNLVAEALNIPKQGALVDAQKATAEQQVQNLAAEKLGIEARTGLTTEQKESEALRNFIHPTDPALSGAVERERLVLIAQECKLKAEFDLLKASILKSAEELLLLTQKTATEKAQITALGVDPDSVVGRQKSLYQAQTKGFESDAIQKAAKVYSDVWNVQRTTDSTVVPNGTNKMDAASVGRAMEKLLISVGA